jgi:hypothetical protein
MPLERRLEFFRSLNPSLARRVMPPPRATGRDDVEGSGS